MGGESRCNDYALELFQCGTVFPTSDPRPPCTLVDQTTPLTAVSSRHARGCYPAGYYEFRNIIISGDVFLRYWILSREDRPVEDREIPRHRRACALRPPWKLNRFREGLRNAVFKILHSWGAVRSKYFRNFLQTRNYIHSGDDSLFDIRRVEKGVKINCLLLGGFKETESTQRLGALFKNTFCLSFNYFRHDF